MDAPLEPVEDLADALERGQFGFALLDERLAVRARIGRLSGCGCRARANPPAPRRCCCIWRRASPR